LVIHSVASQGSPAAMVYQFLTSFFKDDGTLLYKKIVFNLADDEDGETHAKVMNDLVEEISKYVLRLKQMLFLTVLFILRLLNMRVWLFITTHGDEDRGDLFYCDGFCATVRSVCFCLSCHRDNISFLQSSLMPLLLLPFVI
jgi:hypothetical protein